MKALETSRRSPPSWPFEPQNVVVTRDVAPAGLLPEAAVPQAVRSAGVTPSSALEQPRFGAPHRLREMAMSRLNEGFGRRVKLALNEWLPFNSNETAWIALAVGGILLVGLLMGR